MVGNAWRQIKHVAGFEQPVVGRLEFAQELEIDIVAECHWCLGIGADLPAPLANALDQEDVVLVGMRANRAAILGIADHDIVDPPARQEIEMAEQRSHVGIPFVDILHQQGPVRRWQGGEIGFGKRAAAQVPSIQCRIVGDQSRQGVFLAGKAAKVVRTEGAGKTGNGIADQQRFLLPVIAQERGRAHAEELRGSGAGLDHGRAGTCCRASRASPSVRIFAAFDQAACAMAAVQTGKTASCDNREVMRSLRREGQV